MGSSEYEAAHGSPASWLSEGDKPLVLTGLPPLFGSRFRLSGKDKARWNRALLKELMSDDGLLGQLFQHFERLVPDTRVGLNGIATQCFSCQSAGLLD